uniref:GST N-terminal domain-containing protein n=1 Tax=Panagrellus redivivus TaxID=6233 RepID=A0A7E4UMQ3_PANRE
MLASRLDSSYKYRPTGPQASKLVVHDWEKDTVYLIQLPRAGVIPSLSPHCLKLETWLRFAGIPYQNVSNEFKHTSARGQVPFIELNGRQIADATVAIEELTKIFHIQSETDFDAEDQSKMCAYQSMIDNGLLWTYFYYLSINNNHEATPDGVIDHFTGFRKFLYKNWNVGQHRRRIKSKCMAQGIGRFAPYEVEKIAKKELSALSVLLGKKNFLMGKTPTALDASAFATLCQFYYLPLNKDIKNYIDENNQNLVDFIRRIRDLYWSDWSECTSKLSLKTKPKPRMASDSSEELANDGHPTEPE